MISFLKLFLSIFFLSFPLMVLAQKAEMPTPQDFVVGETWEWQQLDSRTKLVEGKLKRSVIKDGEILRFQSESGPFQISTAFLGSPDQVKPWRVWPLEIGKEWEFEEDWKRPDGVSGNTKQTAKVVAFEEVNVPAGKFMAFKIEYRGYFKNSNGRNGSQADTYWYAPDAKADVKRIRDSGNTKWTRELISYKKGGQ